MCDATKRSMARILKRGITLFHSYSSNKAKRTSLFFVLPWDWISTGKHGETEMTSAFSTFPNFIHCFELLKLACKSKDE